jgi:tRNA(fMet)-specific endonuclease VapC
MAAVTVRELRNSGGAVLDRVARGESFIVTRDGDAVAELAPLRRRSATPAELIARRRSLPAVDPERLRRDIDDTSTVILLGRVADPAQLPDDCTVSAITLAELSVGPHVAASTAERVARQAHLQQAEADFEVIPFDAASARAFGRVAASLRANGRKPAARAYDALIAATALANDVPVFTCNPRDFAGIDGLDVRTVEITGPRG